MSERVATKRIFWIVLLSTQSSPPNLANAYFGLSSCLHAVPILATTNAIPKLENGPRMYTFSSQTWHQLAHQLSEFSMVLFSLLLCIVSEMGGRKNAAPKSAGVAGGLMSVEVILLDTKLNRAEAQPMSQTRA